MNKNCGSRCDYRSIIPKACSEVCRIAELADAGEHMIGRLRKMAFLPEARKGLLVRYDITKAAALLPIPILESPEISRAARRIMTMYELERPIGTPKTHKRCRTSLDETMGRIEALIRRSRGIAISARAEDAVNA